MATENQIRVLCKITNHDESGKHFTELYDADDLIDLETEGLIEVSRPIHEPTGIMYDRDQWSVEVTADGQDVVDANPELHPTESQHVELAVKDEHGAWELLGDFDTVEAAKDAAKEFASLGQYHIDDRGVMAFGISEDPASGQYETSYSVEVETGEKKMADQVVVLGREIQYDKSGVGHCWASAEEVDCPQSIQEEIAAEIIDGGKEDCDGYRASNGVYYRW